MSRIKWFVTLVISFWLCLYGTRAIAAQPDGAIVLIDGQDEYPIGRNLEILEDKEKQWTIEDVTSPAIADQFVPSTEPAPGFGFTDSAYWVRFHVRNETREVEEWVLIYESDAFFIDHYLPSNNGSGFEIVQTGTRLPFHTRDVPVGEFVFRLPIAPQETKTVHMRFASEGAMILTLSVMNAAAFARQSYSQQLLNGFLYGMLLVLSLYNLVLYFYLRDKSYLYYVLYFSIILLGLMALYGFGEQYLWPNWPAFGAGATRFFLSLSFTFGLLFSTSFLRTDKYAPILHKIMRGVAVAIFIALGLQFIWFRETAIVHAFLLIVSCCLMIIAGVYLWRKGYQPARYFLLGWTVVLMGWAIFILTLVDVLPFTNYIDTLLRSGLIVLALVLSIGLADRINVYRKEKTLAVVEERNRLARDLHDSVTQSLYSATLLAEVLPGINRRDPAQAEKGLGDLRHLTRGALAEMRTMLLELRPETLVKTPLSELLIQLVEALTSRVEIQTEVNIQPVPDLTPDVHMNFYRIAQESLNNIIKHSQARTIILTFAATPRYFHDQDSNWQGMIVLEVQDDGIGFDHEEIPSNSLGLEIMQERSAEIGADLVVESQPGQGTKIRLSWKGSAAVDNNSAG